MGRSILLLLALAAVQESGDEYFKFAKDTVWTYSRLEMGKSKDVTKKVVKVEGGKVFVEETTVERLRAGETAHPYTRRFLQASVGYNRAMAREFADMELEESA